MSDSGEAFEALLSAANDARNARDLATASMLYDRVLRLRDGRLTG